MKKKSNYYEKRKKKIVQEFGKMATAKQYCEKFFFVLQG